MFATIHPSTAEIQSESQMTAQYECKLTTTENIHYILRRVFIPNQFSPPSLNRFFTPRVLAREEYMTTLYILRTDDRPTDRPKTDRPRISENFERPYLGNGSCDSLRVWFYGRVFGSADRMSLFPVGPNSRSRSSAVLYNFEWP